MATPRVKSLPKEAPGKLVEGKKEEWVIVGRKGKASLTPSAPKQSFAVVIVVSPISIGVQTSASVGTHMVSMEPILGT